MPTDLNPLSTLTSQANPYPHLQPPLQWGGPVAARPAGRTNPEGEPPTLSRRMAVRQYRPLTSPSENMPSPTTASPRTNVDTDTRHWVWARLREIRNLPSDWDSYGGQPPSPESIGVASLIIALVFETLRHFTADHALPQEI